MMKSSIPLYTFYKNKYGSELLIDIVALKDIKKYLAGKAVHTLTYYDITFITEGEGRFVGSPDKPGGLSIQLCKSEKKEFYIRYSS